MRGIGLLLAIFSGYAFTNNLNDNYNEVQQQIYYNQLTYHSADGEVGIVFNRLKDVNSVASGYISQITMCNGKCKKYTFKPDEITVTNPHKLNYYVFSTKIESNITINGFLCNTGMIGCHSYIAIDKDFNSKEDSYEIYYLDPSSKIVSVKRKY